MINNSNANHEYSYSCECSNCVAQRPTEKEIYFVRAVDDCMKGKLDVESLPREIVSVFILAYTSLGMERPDSPVYAKMSKANNSILEALKNPEMGIDAFAIVLDSWIWAVNDAAKDREEKKSEKKVIVRTKKRK